MSSENIRFFLNEVIRRFAKHGTYLEVGTYRGGSLLSAALFNDSTRCIGIDDFTEFNPDGTNRMVLERNLSKFNECKNIEFYSQDYEEAFADLFSKEAGLKIDVYYYDGEHSYQNQFDALNQMLPHLASQSIILVDDINWEEVERANMDFLRKNHGFKSVFKIRTKNNGASDWWNGYEVLSRGV